MHTKAILVAATIGLGLGLGIAPLPGRADTPPAHSEAGQYVADAALTAKVKSALLAEKGLKSSNISVETQGGVVRLSGFVTTTAQGDQAAGVARKVQGVKDVRSELQIKAPSP